MDRLSSLGDHPIVALGIILFLFTTTVTLLGVWLRRKVTRARANRATTESGADSEMLGPVISSILGLLALLLGFTFALAVDRFETRRSLVLDEANAIGTAYLQTQLLPAPDNARVGNLLVRYTDNRIALASIPGGDASRDRMAAALRQNDALLHQLWSATATAFPNIAPNSFASKFVESMNAVIDLDTSRKMSRLARVPNEVFTALFIYIMVSALTLGFVTLTRTTFAFTCVLNGLVVLALLLIIDIDRPNLGGITESQEAMQMLRQSMRPAQPALAGR